MNSLKLTLAGAVCLLLILVVASQTVSKDGNATSASADTSAQQVIRVGTDGTEPAYYKDAAGNLKGFDYEMTEAVAKAMNVKVEWVVMDFDALFPALEKHKIDMIAAEVTDTPERRQTYDFSSPYFVTYLTFLTPLNSAVKNQDDVNGKRISVVSGTIQETYAKKQYKNVKVVVRKDEASAVAAVKDGKADAFFYDATYADPIIKEALPFKLDKSIIYPADDAPIAFVFAKGDKRKKDVDGVLDDMLVNGTWTKIKNEYFPKYPLAEIFASKGVS